MVCLFAYRARFGGSEGFVNARGGGDLCLKARDLGSVCLQLRFLCSKWLRPPALHPMVYRALRSAAAIAIHNPPTTQALHSLVPSTMVDAPPLKAAPLAPTSKLQPAFALHGTATIIIDPYWSSRH